MAIYGSQQAEFVETKHSDHIHRCGAPIFGNIVVNVYEPINKKNQILRRLWNIVRFDMPSVLFTSKAGIF